MTRTTSDLTRNSRVKSGEYADSVGIICRVENIDAEIERKSGIINRPGSKDSLLTLLIIPAYVILAINQPLSEFIASTVSFNI